MHYSKYHDSTGLAIFFLVVSPLAVLFHSIYAVIINPIWLILFCAFILVSIPLKPDILYKVMLFILIGVNVILFDLANPAGEILLTMFPGYSMTMITDIFGLKEDYIWVEYEYRIADALGVLLVFFAILFARNFKIPMLNYLGRFANFYLIISTCLALINIRYFEGNPQTYAFLFLAAAPYIFAKSSRNELIFYMVFYLFSNLIFFSNRVLGLLILATLLVYFLRIHKLNKAKFLSAASIFLLGFLVMPLHNFFIEQVDIQYWNQISFELSGKQLDGRYQMYEVLMREVSDKILFGNCFSCSTSSFIVDGLNRSVSSHSGSYELLFRGGLVMAITVFIISLVSLYRTYLNLDSWGRDRFFLCVICTVPYSWSNEFLFTNLLYSNFCFWVLILNFDRFFQLKRYR